MELDFLEDPAAFLRAAADHLAAEPVRSTVVATLAERSVRERAAGIEEPADFPSWWLVARDGGQVVGAGMRTARFEPHPPYLLSMPAELATMLGETLAERGEELGGINGALPTVRRCAEEYAGLTGRHVEVTEHTRLFELAELVVPPAPAGRLREARADEVGLCLGWFDAFFADAAEQGGRPGTRHSGSPETEEGMLRRIAEHRVLLWVDGEDRPVHLTGHNLPAFGVARIGPVYTPREHRGRGYASAAVAEVSRRLRAAGARVALYTDQANPTSNHVYTAIGFRAVVDEANLAIVGGP